MSIGTNRMSLLMMMKELGLESSLSEVSIPEDTEFTRIQLYHDEWAERINQAYTRDLHRLLAIVEDYRQKKLEAAGAIDKRRALKIKHKAQREEDPEQMKKYIAKSEYAARYYQANKLSCKRGGGK
jgi:translation initiation factor 2 beta subunit (eIF-2beta)/eIF-5